MERPSFGLRGMYVRGMPKLEDLFITLDILTLRHLPNLHKHIKKARCSAGVPVQPSCRLYAVQWFLSLFCRDFDLSLGLKVWDAVMYRGISTLLRVAVAVLKMAEPELMKMNFEGILHHLRTDLPKTIHVEQLWTETLKLDITESVLNNLLNEVR